MQNKCNCGSGCQQGFVPVNGNWDFNMDHACGCQQGNSRRTRRSACNDCEQTYTRTRSDDDCQCERCDDAREVACCDQNTYIRDMDECEYNASYTRSRRDNDCDDDCQCETCTRNRSRRSNDCDKDCGCSGDSAYTRNRSGSNDCDKDCGCNGDSAYTWNRSGNNGCDKDCGCNGDSAYTRNRSGNNGCDKDNASTYARSRKNRTVGMINVERQEIDEIFESESALRAGTLFPELHKPMNGYCPCDGNCGTCAQAAAFAAWELRLYLNTHPNDKEALALFRKLCKEAEDENYATTFLTDDCCASGWKWVKNPWPWEYDCQCGD